MKLKKNKVQVQNPKSKTWVKIDTEYGKILGHKQIPWKNIQKIFKPKGNPIKKEGLLNEIRK